jgi:hypothetical protein
LPADCAAAAGNDATIKPSAENASSTLRMTGLLT